MPSAAWLPLVDRLPPAELLDRVHPASRPTLVELRGPRFRQARENLKKLRALVRRIQNRGYATLARIAAHLDRLAVGDEANAAIDAVDAVNLMTVHAAKGLEFPVVFVVNLSRGTGSRRDPIRVHLRQGDIGHVDADGASGAVSVAVGDFRSDADDDQAAKEREETKRLLYVALTRARDRLYLASGLQDGVIAPGRGSLAEVLPAALLACFRMPRWPRVAELDGVDGNGACVSRLRPPARRCDCRGRAPSRPSAETGVEIDVLPVVDSMPPTQSVAALTTSAADRGAWRRGARFQPPPRHARSSTGAAVWARGGGYGPVHRCAVWRRR